MSNDPFLKSERRICRGCGYGFYWPPILGFPPRVRQEDMCPTCDKPGKDEPDADNNCTIEDMEEISS